MKLKYFSSLLKRVENCLKHELRTCSFSTWSSHRKEAQCSQSENIYDSGSGFPRHNTLVLWANRVVLSRAGASSYRAFV